MGAPLYFLIHNVIFLFQIVLFIYIVTRLLIQFGVVNSYNQFVQFILNTGGAIVEPVLTPIRRVVPLVGGLDLSPIILILALGFIDALAHSGLMVYKILG